MPGEAALEGKSAVEPVSYTHLDVYKRQVQGDALSFLSSCGEKFDVILLDPPYHTELLEKSVELITEFDILRDHGIMICESAAERELPALPPPYERGREYRYGKIRLTVCRRAGSDRR